MNMYVYIYIYLYIYVYNRLACSPPYLLYDNWCTYADLCTFTIGHTYISLSPHWSYVFILINK